jgi:ABC-type multidrug transport system ATPase subunit
MDEATASIDYATDTAIQQTIRELAHGSTIITIAHRLQTIADYDKVLVLDKGRLVEYAHPWELMRKPGGQFRGMCESSGDYAVLAAAAKRAWQGRRLVDVGDEDEDEDGGEAGRGRAEAATVAAPAEEGEAPSA